jgi:spermidine synthase
MVYTCGVIPVVVVERVPTPGGEMVLARRGDEFAIRVGGVQLMSSRSHDSEDELGRRAGELVRSVRAPRMLVGGLGLGYTLRAALEALPPTARVDVVEIVPAVVRWNRTILGGLARHPLDDPRVSVIEDDVGRVIAGSPAGRYHAILLDVDNGPDELFERNGALYRRAGLVAAHAALAPGGVLAVWSAFESQTFTRWLREVGFTVEVALIRSARRRGPRHYIWFAQRAGAEAARPAPAPAPPARARRREPRPRR